MNVFYQNLIRNLHQKQLQIDILQLKLFLKSVVVQKAIDCRFHLDVQCLKPPLPVYARQQT